MFAYPKIKRAFLIVSFFAFVLLGYFVGTSAGPDLYKSLNTWNIVPHKEALTELYINNYDSLPHQFGEKNKVPFSFTISNRQGRTMTYPYTIYTQASDTASIAVIATNTVTLKNNESAVVKATYNPISSSSRTTIFIKLPTINQQLHFALPSRV